MPRFSCRNHHSLLSLPRRLKSPKTPCACVPLASEDVAFRAVWSALHCFHVHEHLRRCLGKMKGLQRTECCDGRRYFVVRTTPPASWHRLSQVQILIADAILPFRLGPGGMLAARTTACKIVVLSKARSFPAFCGHRGRGSEAS